MRAQFFTFSLLLEAVRTPSLQSVTSLMSGDWPVPNKISGCITGGYTLHTRMSVFTINYQVFPYLNVVKSKQWFITKNSITTEGNIYTY